MPTAITPSNSDPALATYDSPIGRLTLAARGGALVGLWAAEQRFFGHPYGIDEASARSAVILTSPDSRDSARAAAGWDEADARALRAAASWLDDYFAGEAPSPAAVPLASAGTDFTARVGRDGRDPLRRDAHVRADRRPAARRGHPRVSPVGRRRARAQSPAPHPPLPQGRGGGRPGRLRGGRRRESLAARA